MLNISAYYKGDFDDLLDENNDRMVNCTGHYRLIKRKNFATRRPEGRDDCQILYINNGAIHVLMEEEWVEAAEGTAILFRPHTPQIYQYLLEDDPDVYWVHFTGRRAQSLLTDCGFGDSGFYQVGCHSSYIACFDRILTELQLRRSGYMELSAIYLEELLRLMERHMAEGKGQEYVRNECIEAAIRYFHENYQKDIVIQDYAAECGMSLCWFIRSFKKYTGMSPQKYIMSIRITKAKELLDDHVYQVGEVAQMVGYQNALYFSRIFRQHAGMAPSQYCKRR